MHVHTFHQSWLNEYLTCPELSRHSILKTYPRDETDANVKGTACHSGIDHLIWGGSLSDAIELAVNEFDRISAQPNFRWVKLKTRDTVVQHIQHGLNVWDRSVYPQLSSPLWVEAGFEFLAHEDDERQVWLKGTVDFMDDVPEMYDWKFTSNDEKYDRYGWEHKRWSIQATVYAWAAMQAGIYGPDETVPFTFAAITPYREAPIFCEVPRNIQHFGFLQQQLVSVAKFIERMGTDAEWPLRDQHALCSPKWCPHWNQCKGQYVEVS